MLLLQKNTRAKEKDAPINNYLTLPIIEYMKKRIYAHLIETSNSDLLEELLANFTSTMTIGEKEVEISHIENNIEFIVGIFVCTHNKSLPPQHTPGAPEDYSAIPLEDGKGLAYPSVFLYVKDINVMLLESNSGGITESMLKKVFNEYDKTQIRKIKAKLAKIIYLDGYERVNRGSIISKFNMRILQPTSMLSRRENDLTATKSLAEESGASKSLEISLVANTGETLNRNFIQQSIDYFRRFSNDGQNDVADKLKVDVQYSNCEGDMVEESINLMLDRFNKIIVLPDQEGNQTTIQATERIQAIIGVYDEYIEMIRELI